MTQAMGSGDCDTPTSEDLTGGLLPGSLTQRPSPKRLLGLKMLILESWHQGDSYAMGVDKVTHQQCAKGRKEKRQQDGAESGERSEERG